MHKGIQIGVIMSACLVFMFALIVGILSAFAVSELMVAQFFLPNGASIYSDARKSCATGLDEVACIIVKDVIELVVASAFGCVIAGLTTVSLILSAIKLQQTV
jgi:hypothetical protein